MSKQSILVVDDETKMRRLLEIMLVVGQTCYLT
jgi:DNA-binding NtrC family response regulator